MDKAREPGGGISVGGDMTGNLVTGDRNNVGGVVIGPGPDRERLLLLLDELRELLAQAPESPERAVAVDALGDVRDEAGKPEAEAEPGFARRRWAKVRELVTGIAATTGDIAAVSGNVAAVNDAVTAVFGAG